jgi:two-component system, LuxR family, sensor kinase FixL
MLMSSVAVGGSKAPRSWRSWPQLFTWNNVLGSLALAAAYLLGVWVGIALTFEPIAVSTLWPPNALVLAALLLTRPRVWPLLIATVFPAHLAAEIFLGVPLDMALCWFASNVAEALIGAALILRLLGRMPRFDRVRDLSVFLFAGVVAAPILSSFLDAYFVYLIGWRYTGYWELWRVRLFSNALATLTLVPLVLIWFQTGTAQLWRGKAWKKLEAAALLASICIVSVLVFQRSHAPETAAVLMYAPLPLLMWAVIRHEPNVVALCVSIVALFAITGVLDGRGPFIARSTVDAAMAVQMFLIIAESSLLLLTASLGELRHARSAARRQEESLDLALGAARMGTWEWDFASNRLSWRIGRAGRSRLRTRTVPVAQMLTRVHADDRAGVQRAIDEALAGSGDGEVECRFVNRRGASQWITSRGKLLLDRFGNPRRMIGVYLDTTERKTQELQMRTHREQLAYLSRLSLMGELSGALAHELNQPLAAILLNAQAACVQIAAPNPNLRDITEMLRDIVADDQRAGEVIHRLRALFLKGVVQVRPLAVNECIREVLALERSYLLVAKVKTHVQLADNLPRVAADRVQLQQVLLNLIVNACEAMSADEPHERRLWIESMPGGHGKVDIVIRDSGPGIDDVDAIFEPFFSTKSTGIGLGLAVSRSIISAHGGRLRASRNQPRGATFRITLPMAAEDDQGETQSAAARGDQVS